MGNFASTQAILHEIGHELGLKHGHEIRLSSVSSLSSTDLLL